MKAKFYIVAMAFATIIMLAMPFVRHHHHNGRWCVDVELCTFDGHENDSHTCHHGDETNCSAENEFVASKLEPQKQLGEEHLLQFAYVLFPLIQDYFCSTISENYRYGEFIVAKIATVDIDSAGMRAPPYGLA
jgi:hypothetical protein